MDQVSSIEKSDVVNLSYPSQCLDWKPKLSINLEQGKYIIKTAENILDFKKVLDLRRKVFLLEFAGLDEFEAGHDFESYDMDADFLMIINKRTGQLLGSYRMICSSYSSNFYSASEFKIDSVTESSGVKLELSRACVAKEFRSGIMIHLLWKGIGEYLKVSRSDYMFGCCSLQKLDLFNVVEVYDFLHENNGLGLDFDISPEAGYDLVAWEGVSKKSSGLYKKTNCVPAFLQSYIHAGAKVYGAPAFDQAFKCLDFFMLLDLKKLSEGHRKKYVN